MISYEVNYKLPINTTKVTLMFGGTEVEKVVPKDVIKDGLCYIYNDREFTSIEVGNELHWILTHVDEKGLTVVDYTLTAPCQDIYVDKIVVDLPREFYDKATNAYLTWRTDAKNPNPIADRQIVGNITNFKISFSALVKADDVLKFVKIAGRDAIMSEDGNEFRWPDPTGETSDIYAPYSAVLDQLICVIPEDVSVCNIGWSAKEPIPIEQMYHKTLHAPFFPVTSFSAVYDTNGNALSTIATDLTERVRAMEPIVKEGVITLADHEKRIRDIEAVTPGTGAYEEIITRISAVEEGEAELSDKVDQAEEDLDETKTKVEGHDWRITQIEKAIGGEVDLSKYIQHKDVTGLAEDIPAEESDRTIFHLTHDTVKYPVGYYIFTGLNNPDGTAQYVRIDNVDAAAGVVKDVKVDGTSVVNADGVAEIDTADFGKVKKVQLNGTAVEPGTDGVVDLDTVVDVKLLDHVVYSEDVATVVIEEGSGFTNNGQSTLKGAVEVGNLDTDTPGKISVLSSSMDSGKIFIHSGDPVDPEARGEIVVTDVNDGGDELRDVYVVKELLQVEKAIDDLNVEEKGGTDKVIIAIKQEDGKIVATEKTAVKKVASPATTNAYEYEVSASSVKVELPKATNAIYGEVKADDVKITSTSTAKVDNKDVVMTSKAIEDSLAWKVVDGKEGAVQTYKGATASANYAVAAGNGATASGIDSIALGNASKATTEGAVALGTGSEATGRFAIGLGGQSSAYQTLAIGPASSASKDNATAIGAVAMAEEKSAIAIGTGAMAMDENAMAIGKGAMTMDAADSIAIGTGSVTSDVNAVAIGKSAAASGEGAVALGANAVASGEGAIALGANTAEGANSLAEGLGTQTNNEGEHAEGKYNVSHESTTPAQATLSSIGIGSSVTDRKNAFEVAADGEVYLKGVGNYDGTALPDASNNVLSMATVINSKAGIQVLTQEEYDAIAEADIEPLTIYFIKKQDSAGKDYISTFYVGTIPFGASTGFMLGTNKLDSDKL